MEKRKVVHPYIPNSVPEVQKEMMEAIGINDIEELYKCIPDELKFKGPLNLPKPLLSEWELKRHVDGMMQENASCLEYLSFLGGGCYQHYVPAICDEVNRRSEFLTAYAGEPYEDHGRFQALFEYASMMAELLEMDVVNVPTYDGSQAAATSLRMASRITKRDKVLVLGNSNPDRLRIIKNYCHPGVEVEVLPFDLETGTANMDLLKQKVDENVAAVYFENPSFFGTVEAKGQEIADLVHDAGGLLVVFVEPNSLGVLAPPSRYGADIVCGDLQSLGLHMYYGGARAGFIATPDEERFVMEYPSRLFGIAPTSHKEWGFGDVAWERTSFAKRENAKEFVGTAAALWAITAGVYLALMGPKGMEDLGKGILQRTRYARKLLSEIPGVKPVFPQTPAYREFVLNFDDTGMDVEEINQRLLEEKIFGCIDLSKRFPSLGFSGLFCVTEIHSAGDIERLAKALAKVIS